MGRRPKSAEVRGRFWEARASGATMREAGVSRSAGHLWLHESGGVRPRATRPRPPLRLSLDEREEISCGLAKGLSATAIAAQLGRSTCTISREVNRNSTSTGYRAVRADRMAQARTRRPRPPKLAQHLPRSARSSSSDWRSAGRLSRSHAASSWTSPTIPRCGSPTRRSTPPCSCRPRVGFLGA